MEDKKSPEVKDAVLTYGEHDTTLKIEVWSLERINFFIFGKLRIVEGLRGDDAPDESQTDEGAGLGWVDEEEPESPLRDCQP